jgi:hypothetical protein
MMQMLGEPVQTKLDYTSQKLLHPSPLAVLPSSQASPLVIIPFPQIEAVQTPFKM